VGTPKGAFNFPFPSISVRPYGRSNQKNNSTLGNAVGWFKTMTTNAYIRGVKNDGWQPFHRRLWQRNYYERIIRNENAFLRITNYIVNNPANWDEDKLK